MRGVSRGEAPLWAEKAGARLECSGLLCGEESKETWVSWRGYPKGAGLPLAHDLAVQGLVCYTFCGGRRRKGLAEGQRKDLSATHK